MTTTKYYRKASVSRGEAISALYKREPNADLESFVQKAADAEEANYARVRKGDQIYVATVRLAEFPPAKDEAFKPEEADNDPDDDGDDDTSPEGDTDNDKGVPSFDEKADGPEASDEGHGEPKPKKMKPEEEMVHLLQQILDAVKGGGGPKPPMGGHGGDLDLPDIGAPEAGGPPLPPPKKAPLPPPAAPKGPGGGMGAFSSVVEGRETFTFRRGAAEELNNRSLIEEAMEMAPGFRVEKIDRRTEKGAAIVSMRKA